MRRFDVKVTAYLGAAVLALALGGLIMLGAVHALSDAAGDVKRSQQVLQRLNSVLAGLSLAQSAQRDFLLTGDKSRLDNCQDALFTVEADLAALNNVEQRGQAAAPFVELEAMLLRQIDFYRKTFELRKQRGNAVAAAMLRREGSGNALERIQQKLELIQSAEAGGLDRRFAELDARLGRLRWLLALCGLAAAALLAGVDLLVQREMRRRQQATEGLSQSLKEVNRLGDLVEALQASQTVEEVCNTSGPLLKEIFTRCNGGLALMDKERRNLDLRHGFGDLAVLSARFPPQDCWALRRGQPHLDAGDSGMACAHLHADPGSSSFCAPLAAQGVTIGLLSLVAPAGGLDERRQKLAVLVAEQISLALANIGLRDRLKDQSVLDPLTGLFNRRYMEENFERERARHQDRKRGFGLAMADIDHFKQFNDRFGHDAGDHVLKEISAALRRSLRPGDILCRFGGEELVLLLPEADLDQTLRAAEHCRRSVEALDLQHQGAALGKVTISLGVAAFPQDGDSIEALMKKADAGLYEAKHLGRNRVQHVGNTPALKAR